jgi:hypothetical protein
MRREEQRIRAAEEEAERVAKHNKLIAIIMGGVIALGLLGYVMLKVL